MILFENELVIDESNFLELTDQTTVDGHTMGRGYIPRDYSKDPVGSIRGVEPFNRKIYPRNEWSSRLKDKEQSKSNLSDFRMIGNNGQPIVSLDQNGQGYCWAYSVAAAIIAARMRDGQPYVRLSAHGVATKIKNFRDEGGWNPLAVEFAIKYGYPDISAFPEKSMNRQHDNSATWANAAKNKITEGFMDLTPPAYSRNMTFDQLMSCLIDNIPCPVDFNWWGHSVCALDGTEIDNSLPLSDINRWGVRIWNSWTDGWSARGMGVLRGSKAIPNGATACKVTTLAA